MLTHLSVNNYVIAKQFEMELHQGMTAVTGETGAGKSIMLGALGLALGDRAETSIVLSGAPRAEIVANFDLTTINNAQHWLQERDLDSDNECVLRRVITKEGRSRAYINGQQVTLQDLRELGESLIDIHSQHAHQSLLKSATQRQLLDEFANCLPLAKTVSQTAHNIQQVRKEIETLSADHSERDAQAQLLRYQVDELNELALAEGEIDALETEHDQLANAEKNQIACQQALTICEEDDNSISHQFNAVMQQLSSIKGLSKELSDAIEMINSAQIQVDEAIHALQHHMQGFEADPQRLAEIDKRLSLIHDLARKHRIEPQQLLATQERLQSELDALGNADNRVDELHLELEQLTARYKENSAKLSKQRKSAAKKLEKAVAEKLAQLSMAGCVFSIALTPTTDAISLHGAEDIAFLISTNPKQAPQPLQRIASGGELSRISLAIQVVTAQTSKIATLVFDEVDVGIGGGTAEIVGSLLRDLGQHGQVLCVTHQPQVAAKANHHFLVEKTASKSEVNTQLIKLNGEEKIAELARMLGGLKITDQTLAHAKEMLEQSA